MQPLSRARSALDRERAAHLRRGGRVGAAPALAARGRQAPPQVALHAAQQLVALAARPALRRRGVARRRRRVRRVGGLRAAPLVRPGLIALWLRLLVPLLVPLPLLLLLLSSCMSLLPEGTLLLASLPPSQPGARAVPRQPPPLALQRRGRGRRAQELALQMHRRRACRGRGGVPCKRARTQAGARASLSRVSRARV
jgi:hypothetical protein